jgi:hypothetical protein
MLVLQVKPEAREEAEAIIVQTLLVRRNLLEL